MSTRTQITCHCGQQIQHKDVLQHGRFLRLFSPSFVYIKYRCSRCKRLGERFVPQDQWDESPLKSKVHDASHDERQHLESLGAISIDEVIDFHFQLENRSLADLFGEME